MHSALTTETLAPQIAGMGELLWDILPTGPRLGGAPANFTINCGRLGNRAVLVSSFGQDDYGRRGRQILAATELDLQQLQLDPDHPTGTVDVTLAPGKEPHYVIAHNVAWDFIRLTPGLLARLRTVNAVCYGTLGQRSEVSRETIRSLVEATSPDCVRVCDINIRMPDCNAETLYWSVTHATIVKVSDEELPLAFSFLADRGLAAHEEPIDPETAAQALLEFLPACNIVATTLGAGGCLVTSREGSARHPGYPVHVIDTVGAGDAFTAGLLHAYLRGATLAQMAEAGNMCGAYVATQPGATPPLPAELIERLSSFSS
jgi:fructokinase